MKDKELLEININTADKYGIQEKYMIEYITSSCVMSKERALDELSIILQKIREAEGEHSEG